MNYTNDIRELETLDLNMPIFALYINFQGASRQKVEEIINRFLREQWNYSNVKILIFPVDTQETKLECVWKGSYDNDVLDIMKNYESIEDLGDFIRTDKALTSDEQNHMLKALRKFKLNKLGIK